MTTATSAAEPYVVTKADTDPIYSLYCAGKRLECLAAIRALRAKMATSWTVNTDDFLFTSELEQMLFFMEKYCPRCIERREACTCPRPDLAVVNV